MAKINEEKLEAYVKKLYRGDLARYNKKLKENDLYSITTFYRDEGKIERKSISKSQEKEVIDTYKNKCVICSNPIDKYDFEIHHIDGDRGNTITDNLIPLCKRCNMMIRIKAKSKLREYKVEQGRNKPTNKYGLPEIKPIKMNMPK